MPYNYLVETVGPGRFCSPRYCSSQSSIEGKLPSMSGLTSRQPSRQRMAAHGGYFGMPHSIREWRGNVYHPNENDGYYDTVAWRRLRKSVIRRDDYTCLRCDKRFTDDKLSAHHLIPRLEGGANDKSNLVTLCNPCHDFVEIHNLRHRANIAGSLEDENLYPPQEIDYSEGSDPYHKEWWHKYVYGGMRRGGRK